VPSAARLKEVYGPMNESRSATILKALATLRPGVKLAILMHVLNRS
jgi:hypothetical protein